MLSLDRRSTIRTLAGMDLTVSTTARCWDCLGVRNTVRPSSARDASREAARATAVFPRPVGAWATRVLPEAVHSLASLRNSLCPGRGAGNGNRSRCDAHMFCHQSHGKSLYPIRSGYVLEEGQIIEYIIKDLTPPRWIDMKFNITGDNLQIVNVEFNPGEVIYSEAGSMMYMSGNVRMEAKAKGGLMSGLKRSLSGESFFVTNFHADGGPGLVGFVGNVPGKIMPIDLRGGKQWLLQKTAFLAAEDDVNMDIAMQRKFGAALFGGEGLILQKVFGEGTVFIAGAGDFIEYNLMPGQVMKVSTANVAAWEASVSYDIQSLGLKTALFGGEGLFVTTLTGPGRIILQSMTMSKLAASLVPYLPNRG